MDTQSQIEEPKPDLEAEVPANETLEPTCAAERPSEKVEAPAKTGITALSVITYGLALGWLLLPAIQYFATVQRTRLQLGQPPPQNALVASLALLDLTPHYLVLLAATFLFGALRILTERKHEA